MKVSDAYVSYESATFGADFYTYTYRGIGVVARELEELLYTHPAVSDVQVVGVPSKQYGEEVMACIILKQGETATAEDIKAFMLKNLARHKVASYVQFMDSFPMNAAGKILKYKMREEAAKRLNLV